MRSSLDSRHEALQDPEERLLCTYSLTIRLYSVSTRLYGIRTFLQFTCHNTICVPHTSILYIVPGCTQFIPVMALYF